ncbi:MAG: hypothetical protein QOD81_4424 [Solirubrobacteraceae bacterium]|jgi:hypothetical protein|nr:hypothetical protein [Solirubrobacteraceae bacterium]
MVSADVPARAAGTLAEAVDWRRRALSATSATARTAPGPGALCELTTRLTPAAGARLHPLRLDAAEACVAADAARRYLAARETGAYLPPAERTRIADLRATLAWLDDAQARLLLAGLDG